MGPSLKCETSLKADISISSSGNNTVIAAPASNQHIVIDHINFVAAGAVNLQLVDGSTNYGGAYPLAQNQGVILEDTCNLSEGLISLGSGNAFVINLSSGVQVSGFVKYRLVGAA